MIRDFISLLFPASCVCCKELTNNAEKFICTNCRAELPTTDHYLYNENDFKAKFYGKLPVQYAFAYLKYVRPGKVQQLLHHLKYKGVEEISELIGNWHGAQIQSCSYVENIDLVVPIPLHRHKLRKRGYNQVDGYARRIAAYLNTDYDAQVLSRKTDTKTQTKKSRFDRWMNVSEIFFVEKSESIKGKHILIADDVVTTGSTLEACGTKLLEAGASKISFSAIATA
ncbi:MAG: competence protein [Thalassobius sp.]|nr:competence protein [Thalassovita sp.]